MTDKPKTEAVIDTEAKPVESAPEALPALTASDLDGCKKITRLLQKAEFSGVKIEDMLATHETITWFVGRLIPFIEQASKAEAK